MKTIIASTDFSPVSLNAVNYAADMAVAIDANLVLFHAYSVPVSYSEIPLALISTEELKQESEKKLEQLKESLHRIKPIKKEIEIISKLGNTVDEMENLCKETKAFAIIIGAKGKSGLENILFGSTALTAIRHLHCPIICVPPGKEFGKGIKKIGFACDYKQVESTTPAEAILAITKVFNATLHILNVDFEDKHFTVKTPDEMSKLTELFSDINPQYHFISSPDVEDGISEFAETNNLDLLITIPKKHKLLQGIFKPSSTKQLIFQSHIPILCLHQ